MVGTAAALGVAKTVMIVIVTDRAMYKANQLLDKYKPNKKYLKKVRW